ncbi:hypothetical protein AXF42_Ash017378 [Apostasia shenzhenica]|uniref:Uncharacterized protein n=1 Tax=Apostasia shenzhenica TaxID=1088818 RepID=A0A2I0BDI1_9ASPA|nr:hypothetical protein AXF42_Ash017378 [Apostasia shenzhenica]
MKRAHAPRHRGHRGKLGLQPPPPPQAFGAASSSKPPARRLAPGRRVGGCDAGGAPRLTAAALDKLTPANAGDRGCVDRINDGSIRLDEEQSKPSSANFAATKPRRSSGFGEPPPDLAAAQIFLLDARKSKNIRHRPSRSPAVSGHEILDA